MLSKSKPRWLRLRSLQIWISHLLAAGAADAVAATIQWTNTAGGNWNVAQNWSPNTIPTPPDLVFITNAGDYTVSLNVNPTLAGLVLGGNSGTQTLAMTSGSLTVNGAATVAAAGQINFSVGALTVTNGLTLDGAMLWSGGQIAATTALTVTSNGVITLTGGGSRTLNGAITNSGTINWNGGGLSLSLSGIFHNRPGALLLAQHPGSGAISGGLFVNNGTIRKSGGTGTIALSGLPFVNSGVLDAQTGAISVGSSLGGGPTTILGEGSSFIGSGTNFLEGNVTLAGAFTSANLVGLTVGIGGTGTLHGSMQFAQNCSIGGGAALTVGTNATLTTISSLAIVGSVTNAGVINLHSGVIFNGGTVHNLASGLIDLKGSGTIGASGISLFVNDGTFRKSAGTGTNAIQSGLPFVNNGTILAQSGTISFSGSLTNPTGTLALAGGKIQSLTPLILPGGRVTGSGTLEAPSLTSAAVVDPGATNAVLVLSGSYAQQLGGSIQFDIGGADPGVNQSQVIVTGAAHLNGLVSARLSPGYTPDIGVNHVVLQTSSLTGDFKCFNGLLLLGENKRLAVSYFPTNLVLTAIAAPDPIAPTLSIATAAGQTLVCWPSEFTGFDLYSSTNLNGSDWTVVPSVNGRHFDPALEPQMLFRLSKPQ